MAEKCYQLFLSGIHTEKTREKYEYYLQRFLKETKLKNFTVLIELDDETRQATDPKINHLDKFIATSISS